MDEQHVSDQDESLTKELEESSITMVDVLQEEEELENNAEAVLGAGDDSICTYNNGFVKRQPLYACITCCPVGSEPSGGICLGCSYHCHEGHELIELYTKRFFRCDCGNSKFPAENPCKLLKDKSAFNAENLYNQNFKGKYCTCSRPYPDPEDTVEDSMIQCIICEDWYHGRHLKVERLPSDEEFSEMICLLCVAKLPFLMSYLEVCSISTNTITKDVDIITVENKLPERPNEASEKCSKTDTFPENKDELSKEKCCKLKAAEKQITAPFGTLFLKENWRKELCTCMACNDIYQALKVSFLTDPEDTVTFYESEGRAKRVTSRGVQREIDALSSLDRITRTELVHEYNNLSTSLREYLRKFAENGKVVKDEDIREFFSELSANKRQKKDAFQYFCK